jgi:4-amino-4-deoxy-L-arabinose transferase-like glycosyltransferase
LAISVPTRPSLAALRERLARRGIQPWTLALAGILLLALLLRLWGIKYGLPFAYQIDEERIYVRKAVRMLDAGSINPHYMHNPPLLTYLFEAIFAIRYGGAEAHRLIGDVPDRGSLFLIGRVVTALIGTVGVGLTFAAARRFFDRRTGLVAALLMAVAFLPVFYSHVALNNVPATAAASASLLGTAGILRRGATRDYVLAGAFVGVAAATKYLDGIVIVPMLTATVLTVRGAGAVPLSRALGIGVGSALAAFVVCNPFAVIHPLHFVGSLGTQSDVVGAHKFGEDPNGGLGYYLHTFTWGLGWLPAIAAVGGAALLLREDRRRALVLVPIVLLFVLYMGAKTRYFGRWMLPAFPIVCMLAAWGAVRAAELVSARLHRPRMAAALIAVAAAALAAQGMVHWVHNDRVLSRPYTLNLVRNWMLSHVPREDKVVTDPFFANAWNSPWHHAITSPRLLLGGESPYARYLSERLVRAYLDHGYCWVVASSQYWGLALSDPVIAKRAARYYEALAQHGRVRFSASPWGEVRRPGGPGKDVVAFNYDWSYDYYPLSYRRPGPMVQVYRLHGGSCSAYPARLQAKLAAKRSSGPNRALRPRS